MHNSTRFYLRTSSQPQPSALGWFQAPPTAFLARHVQKQHPGSLLRSLNSKNKHSSGSGDSATSESTLKARLPFSPPFPKGHNPNCPTVPSLLPHTISWKPWRTLSVHQAHCTAPFTAHFELPTAQQSVAAQGCPQPPPLPWRMSRSCCPTGASKVPPEAL